MLPSRQNIPQATMRDREVQGALFAILPTKNKHTSWNSIMWCIFNLQRKKELLELLRICTRIQQLHTTKTVLCTT